MCTSINSNSFWTLPSPWLGSLDVWLFCNKFQEANLDSSSLGSNLISKSSQECWWPLKTLWNHPSNLGQINMQRSAPCWPFPWMLSQLCRLLLPSNLLPWETSVLSVTSHTAPSASPVPCQADPKATATPPCYRGQKTSLFKCLTHFYETFPCITILPFPLPAEACREMDLAWLAPLWMPGLNPLLLPPSPGCQVPNPQSNPGLAPFLTRQETLREYKSHSCIRLPSSAEDGRRDKQKPAVKMSVININE